MIDIHSHIVFDVDDGASKYEDSLKMLEEAKKAGVDKIIATPHYHNGVFDDRKAEANFLRLLNASKEKGIEMYLGYEVHLNPFMDDKIKENSNITLAGSSFLLMHLPFNMLPFYTQEVIYRLQIENIIPIIAHPERSWYFIKNFKELKKLIDSGCLIQIDSGSITGLYGKGVMKFAKKILIMRMAHFVASDAHYPDDYSKWYKKSWDRTVRWTDRDYAGKLFYNNPRIILSQKNEKNFKKIMQI